ncbi:hypothetical protein GQ457_13G001950 [Hibiscus cannabinus]
MQTVFDNRWTQNLWCSSLIVAVCKTSRHPTSSVLSSIQQLEMEDGDEIDAMLHRTGGGMAKLVETLFFNKFSSLLLVDHRLEAEVNLEGKFRAVDVAWAGGLG